ncbi:hypothetical protein OG738_39005 [Amycolatopsis sp. NBC_01488]|uniref:hypothetical protein n=1 Tax=Amycolatopsis sp. NBC_01488 TaxID=2903563 RepID=UPI002E28E1FC|nr:hypothetical protein [Amycolatopsis sp. NBC_01488]
MAKLMLLSAASAWVVARVPAPSTVTRRWPMTSTGQSAGGDGQPTVKAEFAWIEPEVARWAATVPEGLLDADVWLTPVECGPRPR